MLFKQSHVIQAQIQASRAVHTNGTRKYILVYTIKQMKQNVIEMSLRHP